MAEQQAERRRRRGRFGARFWHAVLFVLGGAPLALAQNAGTADPPGRVGRIAEISGPVAFHSARQDGWDDAMRNLPVTNGDGVWTEPGSKAAIEIGSSRIILDSETEFDVVRLDDGGLVGAVPEGAVYLDIPGLAQGERFEIRTPRGQVEIAARGRYAIGAGDTKDPTSVTVIEGAARVTGDNLDMEIRPNQTVSLTGAGPYTATLQPMVPGPFVTAMLAQDRPPAPQAAAPPAPVRQMTGGRDLSAYGSWSSDPRYGTVWYPRVDPGWAPYRQGAWREVDPWGWTWVSAEPWGFAPYHYGRWAEIGPRWAWVPAMPGTPAAAPPVYAPAVVNFFEIGVASGAVSAALSIGGRSVGWVPLAPGEVYYPAYRASPAYLREVNIRYVTEITRIEVERRHRRELRHFANWRACTAVPQAVFAHSRPVRPAFRRVDERELAHVRPVRGHPPVPLALGREARKARHDNRFDKAPRINPAVFHGGPMRPRDAGDRRAARDAGHRGGPSRLDREVAGPTGARKAAHPATREARPRREAPAPHGRADDVRGHRDQGPREPAGAGRGSAPGKPVVHRGNGRDHGRDAAEPRAKRSVAPPPRAVNPQRAQTERRSPKRDRGAEAGRETAQRRAAVPHARPEVRRGDTKRGQHTVRGGGERREAMKGGGRPEAAKGGGRPAKQQGGEGKGKHPH